MCRNPRRAPRGVEYPQEYLGAGIRAAAGGLACHVILERSHFMRRFFSVLTAVFLMLIAVGWAAAQTLPTDPALVTGQLGNGLRYIVRQHAYPQGRATIWLHIHSGSLNETEPQRGLAHYLEHMAFNGSENFPPGSVVPFFQSLGMTFGRD